MRKKLKIWLKENRVILLIVVLAFSLRLWGVNYGLPGLFVGDEKSLVGGALKMIYERNPLPVLEPATFRLLYYPVLIPWIYLIFFTPYLFFVYLTGNFSSFVEIKDYFTLNPENFFLIARVINVFFSALTIYLIYLVSQKIFSRRAAYFSASLYAVSWLAIFQGHFSKHWNVGGFFALGALYFTLAIIKSPSRKNYLWVGVMVGLAGFTDYIHALYGLLVVLAHFLFSNETFKQKLSSRKLWLFILVVIVLLSLALVTYPQEFGRLAFGEDSTATAVKSVLGFWQTASEVLKTLFYLETTILVLGLVGALALFLKDKKLLFLLILLPLLSPFLYYFLLHFEPRYVLLFLPLLGLLAGFGLDSLLQIFRIKSVYLVAIICLVVIIYPLKNALVFDRMLTQPDTRILAKQWVESNLPAGSRLIINSWEFSLIRNQECIYTQQQTKNLTLRTRDYVMWAKPYPHSYCVWPLDLTEVLPPDFKTYQYYLIDSYTARRTQQWGEKLLPSATMVKEFKGSSQPLIEDFSDKFVHNLFKEKITGPTVTIYQLNFTALSK